MTDMSSWTAAEKIEYIPIIRDILANDPPSTETICSLSDNVRMAVLDIMYPRNPFRKEYTNTRGVAPNVYYAVVLECGETAPVSNRDGNIFFDSYREAGEFLNHLRDSPQWDRSVRIEEFEKMSY